MSNVTALAFADELGPRGRRRVLLGTLIAGLVLVALGVVAVRRLDARGQLEWEQWEPLTQWAVLRFLLLGLWHTVQAAAVAGLLALVIGTAVALTRLSQTAPVRWLAAVFIEFFRGVPLILLIFFSYFGLRSWDVDITPYRALVVALAVYNGAVLGEIFRAGIRSLDRGQTEAAYALGLGYWPAMRLVVIPQALRRMVPAVVSQMVTLLKDTSLGFVITYDDLLRRSRSTREYFNNPLQTMLLVGLMYIVVNFALSRLARWLEQRQRRRLGADAMLVTGVEDVGTVATGAAAMPQR
jgi:glutamate transport system permease protein